jgi:hypothetical protein
VIKQTFLAVAVGAALGATGANAATVVPSTNGTNDFTIEGSEQVAQFAVPDIQVTMLSEYQIDDEVTFTFNAAVEGDFATTLEVTAPSTVDDYNMTFGKLSEVRGADSTSVTYRVTEITSTASAAVTTVGGIYTLISEGSSAADGVDLRITGDRGRASSLDVDYAAVTQNLSGSIVTIEEGDFDGLISRTAQYDIAGTSGFSKTIDSEVGSTGAYAAANAAGSLDDDGLTRLATASRSLFTDGTATDMATVELTDADTGSSPTRTAKTTSVTAVLNGDWSFMTAADVADVMSATMDGNNASTTTYGASAITYTWTGGTATSPVAVGDIVFSFDNGQNGSGGIAMDPGSFTVDVTVAYLSHATDYVGEVANTGQDVAGAGWSESAAVGAWDYDTTNVNVYAVPYGPTAEMFIWVTSTTSNDTPYMVRATGADDTGTMVTETVATGVMAPNAITRLSGDILTGLAATDIEAGRVTLSIEMAAEQCDMIVYAGYKQTEANDRLALETSQSIQGIHNGGVSGQIDDACALGYATGPTD